MGCICKYLCCGYCSCCRSNKYEKKDYKRHKDLTQLDSIDPKKKTNIWSSASNPLSVKTAEISEYYRLPNSKYKDEDAVIKSLGYEMDEYLDQGSFAVVWKARHIASRVDVAVKKVDIPLSSDKKSTKVRRGLLEDIKNELFILQKITHRHVVRLISHFVVTSGKTMTLFIVMQLAQSNLSTLCDKSGPFKEESCKLWFAQMLSALVYVHNKGIAHRDLKLSNILLDERNDVLISDFGLSRLVWRETSQSNLMSKTYCGTPPYMSPELLSQKREASEIRQGYDAMAVDVWALGVIVFKLFNKDYPFPLGNRQKAIVYMNRKIWRFSKNAISTPTHEFKSILKKMFDPNPKTRPKMSDLKHHKWIRKIYETIEQNSIKS